MWSGQQDLNLRPSGPKPDALPDCAMPRPMPHDCGAVDHTALALASANRGRYPAGPAPRGPERLARADITRFQEHR